MGSNSGASGTGTGGVGNPWMREGRFAHRPHQADLALRLGAGKARPVIRPDGRIGHDLVPVEAAVLVVEIHAPEQRAGDARLRLARSRGTRAVLSTTLSCVNILPSMYGPNSPMNSGRCRLSLASSPRMAAGQPPPTPRVVGIEVPRDQVDVRVDQHGLARAMPRLGHEVIRVEALDVGRHLREPRVGRAVHLVAELPGEDRLVVLYGTPVIVFVRLST